MIGLIDINIGNTQSLLALVKRLNYKVKLCKTKEDLININKLILPGVGAFGKFIGELKERKIFDEIYKYVRNGMPILGICVGYQVLFENCEEFGFYSGFKFLKGNIKKFDTTKGIKIPHVGWNNLSFQKNSKLLKDIEGKNDFYFCHSYIAQGLDNRDILSKTNYYYDFVSSIQKNNIYGVQFHPEKSQENGKKIIKNFLSMI